MYSQLIFGLTGIIKGPPVTKLSNLFNFTNHSRDSGIFREIPVDLPGRLFVSPMPTGAYDKGNLLKIYRNHHVDHIFSLVTDDEIRKKARKDIFAEYSKLGIKYSRYIIKDFQTPSLDDLKKLVDEAIGLLKHKKKILVHCHAGVGRTALAVACIVMTIENIPVTTAFEQIKTNMLVNLTSEQAALAERFYSQFLKK